MEETAAASRRRVLDSSRASASKATRISWKISVTNTNDMIKWLSRGDSLKSSFTLRREVYCSAAVCKGYSQSRSSPSKFQLRNLVRTESIKTVRFSSEAAIGINWWERFHPPTLSRTFSLG
ncbi:hypothetical protein RvY_13243 [Ramazzottius varieornatus]|uniref:Uncharacterized protein n=1 Tax=Ramazzottius varieornatus TaxID=947166 RepID=A0A1D1VR99_RAMVA|nr:hypothetical protein RvY_13243 [Ramazzottius varieornatus]